MNHRVVVNVATGRYVKGQERLKAECQRQGICIMAWEGMPDGSPTHEQVPYAFKAYALKEAEAVGNTTLLWADAAIVPIKPLGPLFERIERDGYWMSNNGWTNYEWTADSAYPDLFPHHFVEKDFIPSVNITMARDENKLIPHVVATTFGISLTHPLGKAFLDEYYRLASETKAFCGPWWNLNHKDCPTSRAAVCGPSDVRGHRHDQSCASVIAWRLGFVLSDPPDLFAYPNKDGSVDPRTVLLADGSY